MLGVKPYGNFSIFSKVQVVKLWIISEEIEDQMRKINYSICKLLIKFTNYFFFFSKKTFNLEMEKVVLYTKRRSVRVKFTLCSFTNYHIRLEIRSVVSIINMVFCFDFEFMLCTFGIFFSFFFIVYFLSYCYLMIIKRQNMISIIR